jgi:Concanavalin A-like lectin/glucanases superfamily/BNR repeat-like domain
MKYLFLLLVIFTSQLSQTWQTQAGDWPLENSQDTLIVRGTANIAAGAVGQCLVIDGESLIELKESADLTSDSFSVSLWFNPYDLTGGQQMLAGKNRYSKNERQWSLTMEPDGKLKAHLQQGGWSTITCDQPLAAGRWHQATLVVATDKASLYLNGKPAGDVKLKMPIVATQAPITLGGIWDANAVRQAFHGALDEFSVQPRVLTAQEIAASYRPVSSTHEIPTFTAGLPLWDDSQKLPKANELSQVAGAEFHVIKRQRPDTDGCNWTLGVGLAWHKGKLYASYGYNQGAENTPTEEAHVRVSDDGGRTWGPNVVMDAGDDDLGVSHGVFLSHGGKLWAFMGSFYANEKPYHRVHTRAYLLNESSGQWEAKGSVVESGFWPMQQPLTVADGNWIMSGFRLAGQDGNLPAVAISHGDDFTKWDLIDIPAKPGLGNVWGESTVIVEGKRILNISRYGKRALALLSISEDYGRTWTPTAPSNLPMATSKPYAGTLSNGQRYLVCTTTADTGGKRSPLTIAVSKPGESVFSKVFLVRTSVFEGTPGVSDPKADFSYPYAVEHESKLYIGYTHKSHAANELAVIPIRQLRVEQYR